jgi:hypothetical protein
VRYGWLVRRKEDRVGRSKNCIVRYKYNCDGSIARMAALHWSAPSALVLHFLHNPISSTSSRARAHSAITKENRINKVESYRGSVEPVSTVQISAGLIRAINVFKYLVVHRIRPVTEGCLSRIVVTAIWRQ